MAARRAQASLRELARSSRTASQTSAVGSSSRVTLTSSTAAVPSSSLSMRRFASAAPSTASSSTSAASTSPLSTRGSSHRSTPALGTSITGQDVLSHFSSPPFSSTSSDLLGSNPELALRAVTHESYLNAREGHNRRLAFVGRRTLKLFVTLYLHARLQTTTKGDAAHNYINRLLESPTGVDAILTTHRLGDKVGRQLGLEKIMRWTPAVSDGQVGPRETGLFKVRGVAVEALAGAIYHQKGASEASRFFQSWILPELLQDGFPSPVPEELTQGIAVPAAQS
ncbi:putative mitochondrial ribosomal protein [Pseudozyma hubeiensis]|nr:putative mitochondrial ribosomal protein [Pseudozyma hubeiensis]